MINIIYVALSIRAQTEKTTFSCKNDCTLTKHTQYVTYFARDFEIPLGHIPPLRSFFLAIGTHRTYDIPIAGSSLHSCDREWEDAGKRVPGTV